MYLCIKEFQNVWFKFPFQLIKLLIKIDFDLQQYQFLDWSLLERRRKERDSNPSPTMLDHTVAPFLATRFNL